MDEEESEVSDRGEEMARSSPSGCAPAVLQQRVGVTRHARSAYTTSSCDILDLSADLLQLPDYKREFVELVQNQIRRFEHSWEKWRAESAAKESQKSRQGKAGGGVRVSEEPSAAALGAGSPPSHCKCEKVPAPAEGSASPRRDGDLPSVATRSFRLLATTERPDDARAVLRPEKLEHCPSLPLPQNNDGIFKKAEEKTCNQNFITR